MVPAAPVAPALPTDGKAVRLGSRYAHYYERYANHEKAERIAIAKLPEIRKVLPPTAECSASRMSSKLHVRGVRPCARAAE